MGDRTAALAYLEAAIAKGWRDTGNVRFENDLRGLLTEQEWQALLLRLEGSEG